METLTLFLKFLRSRWNGKLAAMLTAVLEALSTLLLKKQASNYPIWLISECQEWLQSPATPTSTASDPRAFQYFCSEIKRYDLISFSPPWNGMEAFIQLLPSLEADLDLWSQVHGLLWWRLDKLGTSKTPRWSWVQVKMHEEQSKMRFQKYTWHLATLVPSSLSSTGLT